jgi:hypothetical protein
MFGLLSVGDKFPFGRLAEVHSRYDSVINFVYEKQIVSLVTPCIGAGPFRIVLDLAELSSVQMLEYRAGCVILNDCLGLPSSDEQIFHSGCRFTSTDNDVVLANISKLKGAFLKKKQSSTLAFLLSGQAAKAASGFDQELSKQFRQAFDLLMKQEFLKAAQGFRGRGYGLTPSGDDFNTGLLMGLHVRQQTEKKELSKIRASVYTHSLGKDLPVNTFLLQASHGWYNEDWLLLLTALKERKADLQSALRPILTQGETSGADTLTGFLAAWEIKI